MNHTTKYYYTFTDVAVYLKAAYVLECRKTSEKAFPVHLQPAHLDMMSKIFIQDETLKLGSVDFKEEINTNILNILMLEARKESIILQDENLFKIFDDILAMNKKHVPVVLQILLALSYKISLPIDTVLILEKILSHSAYVDTCLSIMNNVILDGKVKVTEETFKVYSNYLLLSQDSKVRNNCFRVLIRGSQNQELPHGVFHHTELVKAAFALQTNQDKKMASNIFEFILKSVESGVTLPIDAKKTLKKFLDEKAVLVIFSKMAYNKQILEEDILTKLEIMFEPSEETNTEVNNAIIRIFEYAAKNNQSLQKSILKKMEKCLKVITLKKSTLRFFAYLAQKGEILSMLVMRELVGVLDDENEFEVWSWRQDLISGLGSMIEANYRRGARKLLPKINKALVIEIQKDNRNIQKICLKVIRKISSVHGDISDGLLKVLVQIGTNTSKSNDDIRFEIKNMFEELIRDKSSPSIQIYKRRVHLANLEFESAKDLLDQLESYKNPEDGKLDLTESNFKQLTEILDDANHNSYHKQVSTILTQIGGFKCAFFYNLRLTIYFIRDMCNLNNIWFNCRYLTYSCVWRSKVNLQMDCSTQ